MQPDEPPVGPHPSTGSGPGNPPPGTVSIHNDATAVLALAFGIVSIPFAVCCGLLGLAAGVGAIVLGVLAIRSTDGAPPRRGLAIAGVVCGAAGLMLTIFFFLLPDGTGLPS